MKSKEQVELELRSNTENHRGFKAPLHYRHLRITDTPLLAPVIRSNARSIRGYLGTFQNADLWDIQNAKKFVARCLNDEFPTLHYLFFIGDEVVGLASLYSYAGSPWDVQIVLAVFGPKYQGKGIGTRMGSTMKKEAFEIWGFRSFWWLVDATNRPSIGVAQKVGLRLSHQWEDTVKHSELESGQWLAFFEKRPENLGPGLLQGANMDHWSDSRTPSHLEAVLDARTN
jgi:RimJ/RimL family protein N-acetyltransferase